jgi:hypothetical protein
MDLTNAVPDPAHDLARTSEQIRIAVSRKCAADLAGLLIDYGPRDGRIGFTFNRGSPEVTGLWREPSVPDRAPTFSQSFKSPGNR